jgi:hypothetical protein
MTIRHGVPATGRASTWRGPSATELGRRPFVGDDAVALVDQDDAAVLERQRARQVRAQRRAVEVEGDGEDAAAPGGGERDREHDVLAAGGGRADHL